MRLKKFVIIISLIFTIIGIASRYVVFAAEKAELIQARDDTVAIMNTQDGSPPGDPYYESDSYQAFIDQINALGGVAAIDAMIADDLATQVDIDNMTSSITTAIAGLILNDTYYATLANFSVANSIDLTPYTTDSQLDYNNEMNRIESILNDPTAGEAAIQALNTDIDNAFDLLVLRGDKTTMNALINQIESIYQGDGSGYIPSTFADFKTAYNQIDNLLLLDVGMTLQQIVDDIDATVEEVTVAETRLNEVLDILVLSPDKQQLINDYNDALGVDETQYTASSYAIFEVGLNIILQVINDPEARSSDVTQAISDLEGLYGVLVAIGDKTDLINTFNEAVDFDTDDYTPNSVLLFQNELERIQQIIASDDVDQTDVDRAETDLKNSYNLLVLQANRSDLELLNQLLIDAYYRDRNLYTASSHALFRSTVDAFGSYLHVNAVINDDNVSQSEVDQLAENIENALDTLVLLVDNSSLVAIYDELLTRDLSDYTLQSREAYLVELDCIYDIITGDELDNQAVADVLEDLSNINDLLVLLPDITALQNVYDQSLFYREEDYSVSSFIILKIAKQEAMRVIQSQDITQAEVDQAIADIQEAIETLQMKPETVYLREGQKFDISEMITLGDATVDEYQSNDDTVLTVTNDGNIHALSYGETTIEVVLSNGAIETIAVFVTAKVTPAVMALTFSIPIVGGGLGVALIYIKKETWLTMFKAIKTIFKKKV